MTGKPTRPAGARSAPVAPRSLPESRRVLLRVPALGEYSRTRK